jgi:hypothetical protein
MRKFFKILFALAGVLLIGLSVFLYVKQGPSAAKAAKASGSLEGLEPGDRVLVKGKLQWKGNAEDDKFLFTADSPALVRTVEMVQWYRNSNDEVYLTLYDRKLPDFEDGGKTYTNPDLPADMTSKVFSGGVSADGIPLSAEAVSQLAGGNRLVLTSAVSTVKIEDLPLETAEKFGLAKYEGFYATPGEEWKLGDIVVSWKYVDPSFYDTVTVYGEVTEDGRLGLGEDGRIWNKDASIEEIDAVIRTDNTRKIIICAVCGALLLLISLVLLRERKQ